MPNHVTNYVEIKGADEKISGLKLRLNTTSDEDRNVGRLFDFNSVIPMPESMNITSGSSTDEGMAALSDEAFDKYVNRFGKDWFDARYEGKIKTRQDLLEHLKEKHPAYLKEGQMALDNLAAYGVKDWYDWACANWGTKWNAYDIELLFEDSCTLVYKFDTAWSSPEPIFDKLVEEGFEVNVFWSDEGGPTGEYGDPFDSFDIDTTPRVQYNQTN